jgi:protein-tyrosine kinase
MDQIVKAVELAAQRRSNAGSEIRAAKPVAVAAKSERRHSELSDAELSIGKLEEVRAVAHDPADPRCRAFDFLRTQVLQAMESNDWRFLAVTSPTPGCGKTFTAINLALSIARQPEGSVLLVDLDLRKPQLAARLGIQSKTGVRMVLARRASVDEAITSVGIGGIGFGVLPCERGSSRSSDRLASAAMVSLMDELRAQTDYRTVIFDLPPMLPSDDVLTVLPQLDCVLMVAAAGLTKTTELTACATQLGSKPVVRVALNKLPHTPPAYGYGY